MVSVCCNEATIKTFIPANVWKRRRALVQYTQLPNLGVGGELKQVHAFDGLKALF
jgi:hypothetical protein